MLACNTKLQNCPMFNSAAIFRHRKTWQNLNRVVLALPSGAALRPRQLLLSVPASQADQVDFGYLRFKAN